MSLTWKLPLWPPPPPYVSLPGISLRQIGLKYLNDKQIASEILRWRLCSVALHWSVVGLFVKVIIFPSTQRALFRLNVTMELNRTNDWNLFTKKCGHFLPLYCRSNNTNENIKTDSKKIKQTKKCTTDKKSIILIHFGWDFSTITYPWPNDFDQVGLGLD